MRVVLGTLSVIALAGCTSPAHGTPAGVQGSTAAEFRSPRLEARLDDAARVLRARGYAEEGAESRGFLVEHGAHTASAELRAGSCYVVLAAGSRAIASLDLALYDGEGEKVATPDASTTPSTTTSSHAGVRFCPPRGGAYWAVARSVEGSGLVAVRTFRGPSGLDVRLDDLVRDVPGTP